MNGKSMNYDALILDTDIGDDIDDAYALCLLMAEKANVIGVSTVYRNAVQRARIASALISLWGEKIPVYAGESYPEVQPLFKFEKADVDGKPMIPHYIPAVMENAKIEEKNGVDFLLDTVRANPYNITVLAIGPFTNLAAAAERDPETFGKIKRILIMGGDYTSIVPEWNILCDPEAADKVFRSGVPIRAVGFDVTKRCRFDDETLAFLRSLKAEKNKLLVRMTEIWIDHNREKGAVPTMHDPLTAETLFDDGLVTFARGKFKVMLGGENRGATVPDPYGTEIEYAADVDVPAFMARLREKLKEEGQC